MKNVMEKIFEHPIGSAILITAIAGGVVRIICTVKGVKTTPAATINITKETTSAE